MCNNNGQFGPEIRCPAPCARAFALPGKNNTWPRGAANTLDCRCLRAVWGQKGLASNDVKEPTGSCVCPGKACKRDAQTVWTWPDEDWGTFGLSKKHGIFNFEIDVWAENASLRCIRPGIFQGVIAAVERCLFCKTGLSVPLGLGRTAAPLPNFLPVNYWPRCGEPGNTAYEKRSFAICRHPSINYLEPSMRKRLNRVLTARWLPRALQQSAKLSDVVPAAEPTLPPA